MNVARMFRVLVAVSPLVAGCGSKAQERPSQLTSLTVSNRAFCHRGNPLPPTTVTSFTDQIWNETVNNYAGEALWGDTPAEQQRVDADARTAITTQVKAQITQYLQNNSSSFPVDGTNCPNGTPTADTLLTPAGVRAMVRTAVDARLAGGGQQPDQNANTSNCTTAAVNTCLNSDAAVKREVLQSQAAYYSLCSTSAPSLAPASVRQGQQGVHIALPGYSYNVFNVDGTLPAGSTINVVLPAGLTLVGTPVIMGTAPNQHLEINVNVDAAAVTGAQPVRVTLTRAGQGQEQELAATTINVTRQSTGGGTGGGSTTLPSCSTFQPALQIVMQAQGRCR